MYVVPDIIQEATRYASDAYIKRATVEDVLSSSPNVLVGESTTTSATSTSTSEAPFFTSGSIGSGSDSDSGGQGNAAKGVLEWVFAIAALLAIASIITWRYAQLRRHNQSIRSFIPRSRIHRSDSTERVLNMQESRRSLPRTTGLPRPRTLSNESLPVAASLFYPPSLVHGRYPEPLEPAPAHLAHSASLCGIDRGRGNERRARRAARGADIDAYGRRGDRRDSDDSEGDDKDELPAYESVAIGGPPRYGDGDLRFVGGMPMHLLTLRIPTLGSAPEATSLERERAIEQALQREASEESTEYSGSPSSDRHRPLENHSPANLFAS